MRISEKHNWADLQSQATALSLCVMAKVATVKELTEQLSDLTDEAQALSDVLDGGGTHTDKEAKRWDALMDDSAGEINAVGVKLKSAREREDRQKRLAAIELGQEMSSNPFATPEPSFDAFDPASAIPFPAAVFRDASTGKNIRALKVGELFSQSTGNQQPPPAIGDVVHSLLTGEPQGGMTPGIFAEQLGGSDTAGGYILNPTLSGAVIDLARSASVAMQAGATTLPMDAREVHIARLTQDPTAQWRAEGTSVLASQVGFDRITLRAKTLAAIVPITIELMEDASNIGAIITGAIQAALGQALDRAVLFGTGAEEEPRGIRNANGVNSVTGVGMPTDYADITSAVGKIRQADYQGETSGLSWITHPRDGETYDGLVDTTGQPLNPSPWARDLQRYSTTALPVDEGGGNESVSILGDFSQVLVGMRTSGVTIRIKEEGQVSDGTKTHNAVADFKTFIVAHLRADVALLRPNWMTVLDGIAAS